MNYQKLNSALEILRVVRHELRLNILVYILESDFRFRTPTEIYNHFDIEQTVASQHLRILKGSGLLDSERNSKFIYYRVNEDKFISIATAVNKFLYPKELAV